MWLSSAIPVQLIPLLGADYLLQEGAVRGYSILADES